MLALEQRVCYGFDRCSLAQDALPGPVHGTLEERAGVVADSQVCAHMLHHHGVVLAATRPGEAQERYLAKLASQERWRPKVEVAPRLKWPAVLHIAPQVAILGVLSQGDELDTPAGRKGDDDVAGFMRGPSLWRVKRSGSSNPGPYFPFATAGAVAGMSCRA